jgi:glyoxylase I family protein
MFSISEFHHASLIVSDTQKALEFYQHFLGLQVDETRPDLGYPGAWLNIGQQQIHLLELPNPDPVDNRPAHGGRDRHLAFHVDSISDLVETLRQGKINYTLSKSGRKALFCRDPDGNALEFIEG